MGATVAKLRKLTKEEVVFHFSVEEDDPPHPTSDISFEDYTRWEQGDVWGWALACMEADWNTYGVMAVMEECTYKDQADFEAQGMRRALEHMALDKLNRHLSRHYDRLKGLIQDD